MRITKPKSKKRTLIMFIYALTFILLPFKIYREVTGIDQRNADVNTLLETVSVGYPVLKTEMYKDMGLILTSRGAVKVTPEGTRWIWNSKEMGYPLIVKRENEDIYVVDSKNKLFTINFKNATASDSELDIEEDSYITQGLVDKDGYGWFLRSDEKSTELIRMDLKDQSNKKTAELPVSIYSMKSIGSDSVGNVWYLNQSGKNYELVRANYDSASGKIMTKAFPLASKVRYGVKFVIDRYDHIWQFEEDTQGAKKYYALGDNISMLSTYTFNETGEPMIDMNGDVWLKTVKPNKKITEFKKLKYNEFEIVYILPSSYQPYSIGDENNLLQTYRTFGLKGTNLDFGYSYIAVNSANERALKQFAQDRIVTDIQMAKESIKSAQKTLAYIDYKSAYDIAQDLPAKERSAIVDELKAIEKDVLTEDIKIVQDAIKAVENQKNLKNYYDIMALIADKVKLPRNAEYLMAELDFWEDGEIFTEEVIEATDAISTAWKNKDDQSIAAAEIAVNRVESKENKKWLMDQIEEIRDSLKKSSN